MRDVVPSATLAFQHPEDAAEQQPELLSWRRLSWQFWSEAAAAGMKQKGGTKQRFKTKTYEWLCATMHMLLIATGRTWGFPMQPLDSTMRQDPARWPCVTMRRSGRRWADRVVLLDDVGY